MPETLASIREEFFKLWVSESGLCLLGIGHKDNDNGILFLVYFLILSSQLDEENKYFIEDRLRFLDILNSLRAHDLNGEIIPGYFHRRPSANKNYEAHDNYAAIVVGCELYGFPSVIEEICDATERNGGSLNNVDPSKFNFKQMRQGSEIALYQILNDSIPELLNIVWLCGGILVNALFSDASSRNLGYLRICGLELALKNVTRMPNIYSSGLGLSIALWKIIVLLKGGFRKSFDAYFSSSHPIIKLLNIKDVQNGNFTSI